MSDNAYNAFTTVVGVGSCMYIMGGATLPYPTTGRAGPNNLKEQMVMDGAKNKPYLGKKIERIRMSDSRMPAWLGWQKYSYNSVDVEFHYVGNRFFPSWYPLQPWYDFKFDRL